MIARRLRTLVFLAIIGFGIVKLLRVLRGQSAPQFTNHPTVNGGPDAVPDEPVATPMAEPVDAAAEPPPGPTPELVAGAVPDGVLADPSTAIAGVLDAPDAAPELAAPPATPVLEAPAPTPELATDADARWVAPVEGACPDGYPIKAKLKSGIYHLPGGLAYDRTKPDRCYATEDDAVADGLRPPKR